MSKHFKGTRWDGREFVSPDDNPRGHRKHSEEDRSSILGVVRVAVFSRTFGGMKLPLVMGSHKDAYKFPGGAFEPEKGDRVLEDTGIREVKEETGIPLRYKELIALGREEEMVDAGGYPLHFFASEVDEERLYAYIKDIGDEGDIVKLFDVEEIYTEDFLTNRPDPDAPPLFHDNRQLARLLREHLEVMEIA